MSEVTKYNALKVKIDILEQQNAAIRAENEKLINYINTLNDETIANSPKEEALLMISALHAELDKKDAALEIYANPDNWKSHDGYMYLATMGHPWADAQMALSAHPAKEEK